MFGCNFTIKEHKRDMLGYGELDEIKGLYEDGCLDNGN